MLKAWFLASPHSKHISSSTKEDHCSPAYPGSKQRRDDEERARIADNQHAAGSSYTAPNPDELEGNDPSGLPWGSVPIKQVFEAGKARQQQSQQTSREGSTGGGGAGSSARTTQG